MSTTVLFYNTTRTQTRELRSMLASAQCGCDLPESEAAFICALEVGHFDLLIYTIEQHSLVQTYFGVGQLQKPSILLTNSASAKLSSVIGDTSSQHIITRNTDGSINLRDLLSTVRKIFNPDIFGVKHYVSFGTQSEVFHIRDSDERHEYLEALSDYCKKLHLRKSVMQSVELFCEEMLMNAIYDAPRTETGEMLYKETSRKQKVTLKPKEAARLEFACDGEKLVVSVSDPFGAMTWGAMQELLSRCLSGEHKLSSIGENGGAGLGLYFCFAMTNCMVINVDPARRSEFIGIFDISARPRERKRRSSNLHFFSTERSSDKVGEKVNVARVVGSKLAG